MTAVLKNMCTVFSWLFIVKTNTFFTLFKGQYLSLLALISLQHFGSLSRFREIGETQDGSPKEKMNVRHNTRRIRHILHAYFKRKSFINHFI